MKVDSLGLAYNVLKRAAELAPGNPVIWHNIGKCYLDKQMYDEADLFFHKAVKVQQNFPPALEGLSCTALSRGNFEEAIAFGNRALVEQPEGSVEGRINRSMGYLALRRWREGWRDYSANLGVEKNRKIQTYQPQPPHWDGTKGLDVVCFGEQGIGDEISFASCLADLIRDSKSVTLEIDGRLERLFARSFPACKVYGTRYKKDEVKWKKDAPRFDAWVAIGELPRFYRNKDSDFPGTPYLIPRPEMAAGWETILDGLPKKPKIGIAWGGGIPKTGMKKRSVSLETFGPLFKNLDANWVSLHYKDVDEIPSIETRYGVKIHDWDWGVRYYDYDQTVALISQLDAVVSVATTVIHAAGGLGIPTYCLVSETPMWRYMKEGNTFPWASSVSLWRQKKKEWPIYPILQQLREKYPDFAINGHKSGARAAA